MFGKTIAHYRIISKLGQGGMGEVYLAEDTRLDRKAAIKLLPAEWASDASRRNRFLKEAKAASALNHPHVCVVYDVGETDDLRPFIAMEYVEGESLDVLVRQGPLEVAKVVEIAMQVADALDVAHQNRIVHRDIKSANINFKDRGQIKVLDFGLAKVMPRTEDPGSTTDFQQTQSGQLLGTPSYMSPEQALGKEIDHRTDIFSLGVVLYELSTGQLPFTGSNFGEIVNKIVHAQPAAIARLNYDVPAELERITKKCLQKSADRRYQSARELLVDLKNLARELEFESASLCRPLQEGVGRRSLQETQALASVSGSIPISGELIKASDVLLNYAPIDDQPLLDGRPGWVSQLHRNLQVRVEQLLGESVNIAQLPAPADSSSFDTEILEELPRIKAMVSVLSPPFIKNEGCRRGVEEFWRVADQSGGQWVDDKARLLKVVKTAVSSQEMPQPLADIFSPLFGFEFFEQDPETGRIREFDETFGPALKQRFFERVYDLAYDVCQLLKMQRDVAYQESVVPNRDVKRHFVYLATTTSDVQEERDRIRRELVERGHVVLPDAPLPPMSKDVEAVVQGYLENCTIAIHLLGKHYGATPEDSSESIPAMQLRLSANQAQQSEIQRMVWMPRGVEATNDQQRDYLRRVHEDMELHYQAEIIEGNLSLLKKEIIRCLAPPEEKILTNAASTDPGAMAKLYLICDCRDEAAVEGLEDYLFSQGLEVCLPAFDGSDEDAEALHRDNLLTCDAVLVYYGSAPKAWVDIKLRELLKARGFGRQTPIQIQAVYVAPPDDHRKQRFRSHRALVIRQNEPDMPIPDLAEFAAAVKEVAA